jgi:hypothetical protein
MNLTEDYIEFIKLLNLHGVKYLVVGAFAVAAYGHPRNTGDIDFWIEPSKENAQKIVVILKEFGFGSLNLSENDFTNEDSIIQLGYEPNRIDILSGVSGLTFNESWDNKVVSELEGQKVNFISLMDLRINKARTGRKQDEADLDNLPKE